jgi:hypothetical protein
VAGFVFLNARYTLFEHLQQRRNPMSSESKKRRFGADEVEHEAVMDNRPPIQTRGRNASGILGTGRHSRVYKDRGEPDGSRRYEQMKNR